MLDDINSKDHKMGEASRWWLHHSLINLNEKLNGKLSFYNDDPSKVFEELIKQYDVNSIFWNNQPANTDGIVIPYYSNIDIPFGTNNIFTDPLFIDDENDFHLSIGSPCIDSGTDFLIADLSGQMLPGVLPDTIINLDDISYFGHSPDMGVYESNYNLDYECIAEDSTEGIELWGQCYSIENNKKVYIKTFIQGKNISKSIGFKKNNMVTEKNYEEIITVTKKELINLVKSENLIDIRTPSFLNVEIKLNNKSNLVEFNDRLKNIDLIDNFYIQKLNKDYVLVKIRYLGKINKIINKLKEQNIELKMNEGQWQLNII